MRDAPLSRPEQELVRALQAALPFVERPFEAIAREAGAGWTEQAVLETLRDWRRSGRLRRVCAYIRHRQAGYAANALVVWAAADEQLAAAAPEVAASPMVSHCYSRPPQPGFPYGLYAMMHGRSRAEIEAEVRRLNGVTGLSESRLLFTVRELKRSDPKLFAEESS